jgi:hypothetical protein
VVVSDTKCIDHGIAGCGDCEHWKARGDPAPDEVYVVDCGEPRRVAIFGHADDAEAYADAIGCVEIARVQVLDHADARRLIEQEEG